MIVVDPPRKGCDLEVLQAISAMAPKRLVMISCNSASLARDCKELEALGYHLEKAAPVDLFPRTTHVECVVLMSRIQAEIRAFRALWHQRWRTDLGLKITPTEYIYYYCLRVE